MRIYVNVETPVDVLPERLEAAVRRTLEEEGVEEGEVSVTLLEDDGIRALNQAYLGRDRPTDVLAFSLGDEGRPLGDVYLGVAEARRQAADRGVPLGEELVRLAVHGTLHVLGYDHPDGPAREDSPMYARQERLVRSVLAEETS